MERQTLNESMQGVHNSVPARNTPKRKDIYFFIQHNTK